jgi:hypothetical protein
MKLSLPLDGKMPNPMQQFGTEESFHQEVPPRTAESNLQHVDIGMQRGTENIEGPSIDFVQCYEVAIDDTQDVQTSKLETLSLEAVKHPMGVSINPLQDGELDVSTDCSREATSNESEASAPTIDSKSLGSFEPAHSNKLDLQLRTCAVPGSFRMMSYLHECIGLSRKPASKDSKAPIGIENEVSLSSSSGKVLAQ